MLIVSRKDGGGTAKLGCSLTLFDLTVEARTIISVIKVIRIERDTIKLGFSAPAHVVILRQELVQRGVDLHRPYSASLQGDVPVSMLVLSRRTNEVVCLFIGGLEVAQVKIIKVKGNVVKIGVEAPREKVGVERDDAEIDRARYLAKQNKNPLTAPDPSPTQPATTVN